MIRQWGQQMTNHRKSEHMMYPSIYFASFQLLGPLKSMLLQENLTVLQLNLTILRGSNTILVGFVKHGLLVNRVHGLFELDRILG